MTNESEPIRTTEPTPTVRLKNGSDEAGPLVASVMYVLNRLMDEGLGTTVHEMNELAKDPDHIMFGNTGDTACDRNILHRDQIIEDPKTPGAYRLNGSVRNILESAIVPKDDGDMLLVNPVAESEVGR